MTEQQNAEIVAALKAIAEAQTRQVAILQAISEGQSRLLEAFGAFEVIQADVCRIAVSLEREPAAPPSSPATPVQAQARRS